MRPEKEVKQYLKEKWSEYAHKYSGYSESSKLYSGNKKESWKEILTNALETTETLIVLDVGTGPGTMAFILAELGHNVTGIDLSEGMVEKAMEHAMKFNLPVKFRQGDRRILYKRIWQLFLASPLILITDQRWLWPWRLNHPFNDIRLPMRGVKRPDTDIELLKTAGFTKIEVDNRIRMQYSLLNHLKYGYQGNGFLISAIKGGGRGLKWQQ